MNKRNKTKVRKEQGQDYHTHYVQKVVKVKGEHRDSFKLKMSKIRVRVN